MQQLVTLLHIFAAFSVVGLVLMQRGKGSDMGASFGAGASGTMFGSQGSTPFLVKLTGILAMVFFLTSATLSFILSKSSNSASLPTSYEQPIQENRVPTQTIPTAPSSSAQPANNASPISLMDIGKAGRPEQQGSSSSTK